VQHGSVAARRCLKDLDLDVSCRAFLIARQAVTSRFATPRKLIGYAGLAPRVHQSGERAHTGALSKAGSCTLRWAAVEAAHAAWRPSNPLHRLYTDVSTRAGKNPAKSAVACKILIACWHILSRDQPFKPARSQSATEVSASSSCFLAA
jgi:transposase